jgi:hypothetical protein
LSLCKLLTVIKYFRFLWSVQIWKLDTLLNSASHFSSIVWWSASLYHKFHNCTLQMHSSLNSRHRVFTHYSLTVTEFHLCINLRNLFSSQSYMCDQMKLKLTLEWTWVFSFLKSWSAFSVHLKVCSFIRIIINIIRLKKFLMNFQ